MYKPERKWKKNCDVGPLGETQLTAKKHRKKIPKPFSDLDYNLKLTQVKTPRIEDSISPLSLPEGVARKAENKNVARRRRRFF